MKRFLTIIEFLVTTWPGRIVSVTVLVAWILSEIIFPIHVPKAGDDTITIEVAVFQGGFGIDFYNKVARQYERKNPHVEINLWGSPRVDLKLKPRILMGEGPDIAYCGLPFWKLVDGGKIMKLNEYLAQPTEPGGPAWRDTFVKGALERRERNGEYYAVPVDMGGYLLWYNRRLFERHGWTPPATWDEFEALCESIKAAGLHPIAFQGKYVGYINSLITGVVYREGGPELLRRWYRLDGGVFTDPAFTRALERVDRIIRSYFQEGCLTMDHIQAQLEFVRGNAAMVMCGTWLYNEMKANWPDDFELDCFDLPMLSAEVPYSFQGFFGALFFVFSHTRHPDICMEFLQEMTSHEMGVHYTEALGSLSTRRGTVQEADVGDRRFLYTVADLMEKSEIPFPDTRIADFVPEWGLIWAEAIQDFVYGKRTPEEIGRFLDDAAVKVKRDNREIFDKLL